MSRSGENASSDSSCMINGIFHERQRRELCALHALNNVFQHKEFSKDELDQVCNRLAPASVLNPHKSFLGTGNYDINVIMAALQSRSYQAVWHDKRKKAASIDLGRCSGFIINSLSTVSIGGFLKLPIRRRHWTAIQSIDGEYWNLDSKLKTPEKIGDPSNLIDYLKKLLSDKMTELFLIVTSNEAELNRYYKSNNGSISSTEE